MGVITVSQIGPEMYEQYAKVRPEFIVESELTCDVVRGGLGGLALRETPVARPYPKYGNDDDPADWAETEDLSQWAIFLATLEQRPVGGAAVAPFPPGFTIPEIQEGVAGLWDIRVASDARRRGVGTAMLEHCAAWARVQGFTYLDIETQNVNVPACRFYAKQGCEMIEIRRHAYAHCPEFAHEVMLIWRLRL
jgi:ribosomal protein S18 acetylase RimI-like enzyme